jgi:hypothetical protein
MSSPLLHLQVLAVLTDSTHPLFLSCVRILPGLLASSPLQYQEHSDVLSVLLHASRQLPGSLTPRLASLVAACIAEGLLCVRNSLRYHMLDASLVQLHMVAEPTALVNLMLYGIYALEAAACISDSEPGGWEAFMSPPEAHLPRSRAAAARFCEYWNTPRMSCLHLLALINERDSSSVIQALPSAARDLPEDLLEWMLQSSLHCRSGT